MLVPIKALLFYKCKAQIIDWYLAEISSLRMFALIYLLAPNFCHYLVNRLTTLTLITHVSCVPKKNTWYLFEGDFTAPSGNSSICKLRTQLLKKRC